MSAGAAIVSDKQLGDVLLLQSSACYLALQTGKPTALHVREGFRPLIELMPGCTSGAAAPGPYDAVWCTSWSSKAVWQAFKLKTGKRRLLVNKPRHLRWWYRLVFHEIRMEPPSAEYWARYFWRAVSGLPEEQFTPPQLKTPPAEWRHPELPDDGFIVINPTAAWERKFWSVEQWAEIIRRLSKESAKPIVIAGGGSDREKAHCQAIAEAGGTPVLNLAGRTSLQQYLHLLSVASRVLCIDGAASHLAQAFGVPTVTVFGPTHEGKWHWQTPQHRALAGRQFNAAQAFGPPSDVPADAVWSAACAVRMD